MTQSAIHDFLITNEIAAASSNRIIDRVKEVRAAISS